MSATDPEDVAFGDEQRPEVDETFFAKDVGTGE
jgi:hypothetical protein